MSRLRFFFAILWVVVSFSTFGQPFQRNHVLDFAKGKAKHISAKRTITFDSESGLYRVELRVSNHKVAGYINVFEFLGEGLEMMQTSHCPCLQSHSTAEVKFNWVSVKKGQSVNLVYYVKATSGKHPSRQISGGILYHLKRDMPSTAPFTASPKFLPLKARPQTYLDETGKEQLL